MSSEIPIKEIKVGRRYRRTESKSNRDFDALKESMKRHGMLHPIVLDKDHRLIAGARRLKAAKALKWDKVPVRIVHNLTDATDALRAERDENTCRRDFMPSEMAALAKKLLALERGEAKKRQGSRTDKHPEKLSASAKGRAKDKVAKAVGTSRPTMEKINAVVEAAGKDPEKFGHLVDEMDTTGKVDPAFRHLEEEQRLARINAARPRNDDDEPIEEKEHDGEAEAPEDEPRRPVRRRTSSGPLSDDEELDIGLVTDGDLRARLTYQSGDTIETIEVRSLKVLNGACNQMQKVITKWKEADRQRRRAEKKAEETKPAASAAEATA